MAGLRVVRGFFVLGMLIGCALPGCASPLGVRALGVRGEGARGEGVRGVGELVVVRPDERSYAGPPAIPELAGAWLLGGESDPHPYALRVRLASGGRIPPHVHPDDRHTVVLVGTLYVGMGEDFDADAVIAVPAGAVYLAPANVYHYVWARDGDVEYQENGVGPTATRFVEASTPR